MVIDRQGIDVLRKIKISASFQIGQIGKHDGVIVPVLRQLCHDLPACFYQPIHLRHRIGKQHIRFLAQRNQYIMQCTDGPYIISVRMLMTDKKEPAVIPEEIPGKFLADFFSVSDFQAHLSPSF